jgi:ferredoxin
MAKIINESSGESREVPDGESIRDESEALGIPLGCQNGICGTCMIDVVEGAENLSELTREEKDLERDKEHRLACQCKIKKGEMKFKAGV